MIIFYYGTDAWRMRQEAQIMKGRYRLKYASGVNLLAFDFSQHAVKEFVDAIKNISFFDEVRLCVLTNVFAGKPASAEMLTAIHERGLGTSKETILMILENASAQELAKQNAKLFKLLTESAVKKQEFSPLSGAQLQRWVAQECAKRGRAITPKAVGALVASAGNDSWALICEIEKLANFCPEAITEQTVSELVSAPMGDNVFELTDALAARDQHRALSLLYRQLAAGNDPNSILGAVIFQFRALLAAKSDSGSAPGTAVAARALGIPNFVLQKATHFSRKHQREFLARAYQYLAQIDWRVKRGISAVEDELYRFILLPEPLPI